MKRRFFTEYSELLLPILFLLGFLAGVMWICISHDSWMGSIEIFKPDFLWKTAQISVNKRALCFLVLGKRLQAIGLLWLLSYSVLREFTTLFFFFFNGLSIGIVMETLAISYGIKGLLLYLGIILPQAVFYVPGFFLMGLSCLRNCKEAREVEKGRKRMAIGGRELWLPVIVIVPGCLLEAYINPELLRILVNFLL